MRRPASFDPGILLILLSVVILGGTGWLLYSNLRTDEITARIDSGEMVRAALVIEQEGEPLLSNVLFYNPRSNRLAMFDIPQNLGAILDRLDRVDRLSVLYEQGAYDSYRREVSELLGVSVPFYIFMDLSDLSDLVDLMGGLELFVSDRFGTERTAEGPGTTPSEPRLPSGTVKLEGPKVKSYISYQAIDEGAIERVSRQQEFLQSLVQALGENSDYLSQSAVADYFASYIDTNLNDRALLALVSELSQLDSGSVITRRVQGTLREVDIAGETRDLLFPHFEGQWLRQTVRQVEQSLSAPSDGEIPHRSIALQIFNGTVENGLAARTRALYEGYGFNVVAIGNATDQSHEKTTVISHGSGSAAAQQVAGIIRADRIVQRDEPPGNPGGYQGTIDVTLILGEDFDGTYVR